MEDVQLDIIFRGWLIQLVKMWWLQGHAEFGWLVKSTLIVTMILKIPEGTDYSTVYAYMYDSMQTAAPLPQSRETGQTQCENV